MKTPTFKPKVMEILRRKKPSKPPKEEYQSFLQQIPEVKPLSLTTGAFIFVSIAAVGLAVGAVIGTYVFFGTITLAGLIAIVESNKYLKYIAIKSNKILDLIIFGLTIYSTVSLDIMMTASLTVTGLGYTLVYAPYLRSKYKK